MGANPSGFNHSPWPNAVWNDAISATGNPQNSADNPRTRPRSEVSSRTLRSASGMAALEGEVSVFAETAFIIVQPSHAFGRFHPVALDRIVNLRLQLARQILLVILHRSQRLHN